ncbi:hypothetical protein GOODEAATRI_012054 [Goodea atripinnis]|uniref:RWD domain-containing protein n=1 Tax=Goodea atripinnis TaxID=208336 RepID=A0ABV0PDH2_9TELE
MTRTSQKGQKSFVLGTHKENELLALASIYDEEEFRQAESAQGGEIQLCLELPPDFKLVVKGTSVREKTAEYNVCFLPPLVLNFELPADYPSTSPPIFSLSSKWMTKAQLDPRAVVLKDPHSDPLPQLLDFDEGQRQRVFDSKVFCCGICFSDKLGSNCLCFKGCQHVYCKVKQLVDDELFARYDHDLRNIRDEYLSSTSEGQKFMEQRFGKRVVQKAVEESFSRDWLKENCKCCPRCGTNIQVAFTSP